MQNRIAATVYNWQPQKSAKNQKREITIPRRSRRWKTRMGRVPAKDIFQASSQIEVRRACRGEGSDR
jgi:hypothetical protein